MFVRFTTDFVIIQLSSHKCQLFFSFFCFIFYNFKKLSFDIVEWAVAGKRIVWILFLCNGEETQKLWKPLLTQFSPQKAPRNGLRNSNPNNFFPATAHTTYIIQHFRINQKNLRIAPKIFLIIFYIEDMSYTIP